MGACILSRRSGKDLLDLILLVIGNKCESQEIAGNIQLKQSQAICIVSSSGHVRIICQARNERTYIADRSKRKLGAECVRKKNEMALNRDQKGGMKVGLSKEASPKTDQSLAHGHGAILTTSSARLSR
jgi:hypothetical protein